MWPVVTAILLTMLAAWPAAGFDTDAKLREGRRLHDAGQFDAAIAVYEEVLKVEPSNAAALYEAGFSCYTKRDFATAVRYLERGLATSPANSNEYNHLLGGALEGLGDLRGAEAAFRRAVVSAPERGTLYYSLGINLNKQGRLVEATRAFEDSLVRRPTHVLGWAGLTHVLEGRRYASRALVAHARLLTLQPEPRLAAFSAGRLVPLLMVGVRDGEIQLDMDGYKANDVPLVDEMARAAAATRRYTVNASDPEAVFFAGALDLLFKTLSGLTAKRSDDKFWTDQAFAYFDEARTAGYMETLAYEIRRPTNDPTTLAWLSQHAAEVERFRAWSASWSPKNGP